MNVQNLDPVELAKLDSKALMRLESEIAHRHMGHFPWMSVTWAFANLTCWLALWPLFHLIPLWLTFLIASANVALCYLPSHEAQHDIIARPGDKLRWLNQLVGHLSTIPLVASYGVLKLTHMEHHKHTNNPDLDPDYESTRARTAWASLVKTFADRQPGSNANQSYGAGLKRLGTPEAQQAGLIAALYQFAYLVVLITMAWTGHAIEAAMIWWLPRIVGQAYIRFFLSWAPHYPCGEGRYQDTRGFRSHLGNILSSGMQFHIVHHLHPRIPLIRNPAAYWELRPILQARGCRIDQL